MNQNWEFVRETEGAAECSVIVSSEKAYNTHAHLAAAAMGTPGTHPHTLTHAHNAHTHAEMAHMNLRVCMYTLSFATQTSCTGPTG